MPGAAHETLVGVIRSNPACFETLLEALEHAPSPPGLTVADSAVRVADPVEVRPDVLFARGKKRGPWRVVELQRDDDEGKQRRWLLTAAALFDQRGEMGDVFVVTHTRATARWAAAVASVVGPQGTRLSLEPVVILLTRDVARRLLATGRPELAVFATWAVHHQRGPQAVKVVERALLTVNRAKAGALRDAAIRAIFNMLDGRLREAARKMTMDFSKIPEGPVHKYLREVFTKIGVKQGEKRGKELGKELGKKLGEAEALLRVLAARGFTVSAATRKRVLACDDKRTLDRWIDRAATATTLEAVFGTAATRAKRRTTTR
ncbi:MAG: hypothetical protein U0324_17585 [Polyangiales bacterium]